MGVQQNIWFYHSFIHLQFKENICSSKKWPRWPTTPLFFNFHNQSTISSFPIQFWICNFTISLLFPLISILCNSHLGHSKFEENDPPNTSLPPQSHNWISNFCWIYSFACYFWGIIRIQKCWICYYSRATLFVIMFHCSAALDLDCVGL